MRGLGWTIGFALRFFSSLRVSWSTLAEEKSAPLAWGMGALWERAPKGWTEANLKTFIIILCVCDLFPSSKLLTKMDDQRENPTSWQRKRTDLQCQPSYYYFGVTSFKALFSSKTIAWTSHYSYTYIIYTLGIYHKSQFLLYIYDIKFESVCTYLPPFLRWCWWSNCKGSRFFVDNLKNFLRDQAGLEWTKS